MKKKHRLNMQAQFPLFLNKDCRIRLKMTRHRFRLQSNYLFCFVFFLYFVQIGFDFVQFPLSDDTPHRIKRLYTSILLWLPFSCLRCRLVSVSETVLCSAWHCFLVPESACSNSTSACSLTCPAIVCGYFLEYEILFM